MKVIVFVAHPDDETMFAGGTIALLARAGAGIDIVCATRGEGGESGDPPLCEHALLGNVRSEELRCAARALGCRSVTFLEFVDPDVKPDGALSPFATDSGEVQSRLHDVLALGGYDSLLTHGTNGEYGHPGHVLAHQAALATARVCAIPTVLTFGAWFPNHPRERSANRSDRAAFVIDYRAVWKEKLAAVECHRTQHALFVRRPSQEAGHPVPLQDTFLRVESFHRAWGSETAEIVRWFNAQSISMDSTSG
jgi:N-acetylglucosamine malate deacetylase 2